MANEGDPGQKLSRQERRKLLRLQSKVEQRHLSFPPPIRDEKEALRTLSFAARQLGLDKNPSELALWAELAQSYRAIPDGTMNERASQRTILTLQTMEQSENPFYSDSAAIIMEGLKSEDVALMYKDTIPKNDMATLVGQISLEQTVQLGVLINSRFFLSHNDTQTFAGELTKAGQRIEELLDFHSTIDQSIPPQERIELHTQQFGNREELIDNIARAEGRAAQARIYQAALGWKGSIMHYDLFRTANFAKYGSDPESEGWKAYVAPDVDTIVKL
jgi:hypothetical protein